jgi:hypothetical protein
MKTIVIYNEIKVKIMRICCNHSQHPSVGNRSGIVYAPTLDTLGVAASSLCLVHCLLMPLVILMLPALSASIVHNEATHYLLAVFVTIFCLTAVVPGYLRHSRKEVLFLMLVGLSLVLFATFVAGPVLGESWEVPLISVGNLLVVGAHVFNRRLCSCLR